jgi:Ca-activated chloride channel family protein
VRLQLAAVALAACSIGWLDPHARAREASKLFAEGKYEDAAASYNEALVDDPDSALLHFNLGDAQYKQGKFTDAVNAFQQVAPDADAGRAARVAYNIGNAKYRLGEAAASSDPKSTLGLWAEALVAYRRAMGADAADLDAKYNHELVERKIAELKKKLEEQRKQQDQQEQEQQEQEQQKQEQKDQQEQSEQQDQEQQQGRQEPQEQEQQAGQEPPPEQQPPEEQAGQPKPQEQPQASPEQQPADSGGEAAEGEESKDGEMSRQEAAALLDAQRGEEVQPEEITKRLHGAVVGGPAEDW